MYSYTKNNHFKFGYNHKNEYQVRNEASDVFTAEYGKVMQNNISWREANNLAAREISGTNPGKICILLSGGMDSEICLRSFADQNIPFFAVSLRFSDVDQSSETFYIDRLKEELKFQHRYVDLKLNDFVNSSEFFETVNLIKCVSPIVGCHLWLANQVDGLPVIAQGEVHLKKEVPINYRPGISTYDFSMWYLIESERLCSIYMNFIIQNKSAVPGFFQYLPEQALAFLTDNPILSKLVNNEIPGKLGTRTSKNAMSLQYYPTLDPREKLHGWENCGAIHDLVRAQLAKRFPHNDAYFKISYNELLNSLSK